MTCFMCLKNKQTPLHVASQDKTFPKNLGHRFFEKVKVLLLDPTTYSLKQTKYIYK